MVNEGLKNFAEELKNLREKKAISLNEIYDKTRIDVKYLGEIENGNFDVLPEVYMRAFLRKYAVMIDLDEDEILSKYEIAKSDNSEAVSSNSSSKIKLDKEANSKKSDTYNDFEEENNNSVEIDLEKNKKNVFLIGSIVLISAVIVILYLFFFQESAEEIIVEKTIDKIISERNENANEPKLEITDNSSKNEIITAVSHDSLSLKINAIDTSWMRIMIDDKLENEFILNSNLSKSLKAKSNFTILIGNAGGVELVLNGNKLPMIGKKGEIKNISVDLNGIHYMRIKKP